MKNIGNDLVKNQEPSVRTSAPFGTEPVKGAAPKGRPYALLRGWFLLIALVILTLGLSALPAVGLGDGSAITKEITSQGIDSYTGDYDVTYRLVINPSAVDLVAGEYVTVKDTVETGNLSIDYTSIRAEPSQGVHWNSAGSTITYRIPDETAVTITYTAHVIGSGQVRFTNTAAIAGTEHSDSVTRDANIPSSLPPATGSIRVLKFENYDMTKTLPGVEFQVYEAVYDPLTSSWSQGRFVKNVTTNSEGIAEITGLQTSTTSSEHWYMVLEQGAPTVNGITYQSNTTQYTFQIRATSEVDYTKRYYCNGDVLTVRNTPSADNAINVNVVKYWQGEDGDTSMRPDSITLYLYQDDGINEILYDTLTVPVDRNTASTTYALADLPYGYTYRVDEKEMVGYTTAFSTDRRSTSGDIVLYNTRDPEVTGPTLTVNKAWMPDSAAGSEVTVTVYKRQTGTSDPLETVGILTLTEAGNWTDSMENLEEGYDYFLEEIGSTNIEVYSEDGGTVSGVSLDGHTVYPVSFNGGEGTMTIVNESGNTGSLSISKKLENAGGDTQWIRFDVDLQNTVGIGISGNYGLTGPAYNDSHAPITSIDFVNGKGTFWINADGTERTVTITGLPEGALYSVMESDPEREYKLSVSENAQGVISASGANVRFVNVPDTGISFTVNKVWLDSDGNVLSGDDISGLQAEMSLIRYSAPAAQPGTPSYYATANERNYGPFPAGSRIIISFDTYQYQGTSVSANGNTLTYHVSGHAEIEYTINSPTNITFGNQGAVDMSTLSISQEKTSQTVTSITLPQNGSWSYGFTDLPSSGPDSNYTYGVEETWISSPEFRFESIVYSGSIFFQFFL